MLVQQNQMLAMAESIFGLFPIISTPQVDKKRAFSTQELLDFNTAVGSSYQ